MKYLLLLAVVLYLTGCATSSNLQSNTKTDPFNQTITVFTSDGIVYVN